MQQRGAKRRREVRSAVAGVAGVAGVLVLCVG